VVVPVRVVGLTGGAEVVPVGPGVWGETRLELAGEEGTTYRNLFTGERLEVGARGLLLREVLGLLPCAVLEREAGPA